MKNKMLVVLFFISDLLLGYLVWFCVGMGLVALFVFKDKLKDLLILDAILTFCGILSWYLRGKLRGYKAHLIAVGVITSKKENYRPY